MPTKLITKKSVEDVVKKSMPGWRVVSEQAVADNRESVADSHSVDLAALRRKYLGTDADSELSTKNTPTKIVVVEPQNSDAFHRRSGRKAVVISGDEIIGAQG